ncbi:MAG: putative S-layer protein [Candidatus Woesearchaeota archaeon]
MENKTIALMVLSVLSVIAVLGMASAAITLYPDSYSATIQQGSSGSFTFIIHSNGDCAAPGKNCTLVNITSVKSSLVGSAGTISSSAISVGTMPPSITNDTNSSSITVSVSVPSTQAVGVYTGNITINGVHNETNTSINEKLITLSITVSLADAPVSCSYNNTYGNLRIKKIEFTNNGFSGAEFGKDDEWFPIDEITVEMIVENNGNDKIEDIELEWGLYDPDNDQWIIDFDDEDQFDLKADKTNTVTVEFTLDDVDVDLEDIEDGTYVFYVKATGYDNEFEEDICVLDSPEAEIIIESDFVVLDKIEISEITSCGIDILVSANVWNIGDDDQEGVYVNIYNKELKIDKNVDIGDVDAFSYEKLDTTIAIPSNAVAKFYGFVFTVYDENDDVYETDFDDDKSVFTIPVKVNCTSETSLTEGAAKAVISASLVSGGKAGQDLVVKSTIVNLDIKPVLFTVSVTGYSDWASSVSIDSNTFSLGTGESNQILLTFRVRDDAEGENLFDLELYSENKLISKQPVSVSIEKKGFSLPQIGGGNYIWLIALVNVILVMAIIVVAVKVMRK